jgi:hypothetical protein
MSKTITPARLPPSALRLQISHQHLDRLLDRTVLNPFVALRGWNRPSEHHAHGDLLWGGGLTAEGELPGRAQ